MAPAPGSIRKNGLAPGVLVLSGSQSTKSVVPWSTYVPGGAQYWSWNEPFPSRVGANKLYNGGTIVNAAVVATLLTYPDSNALAITVPLSFKINGAMYK